MASRNVETIENGFWKRFSQHVDKLTVHYKRKNILFAILHLANAVLDLVKCDPASSQSIEIGGEVVRYLVLVNLIKKHEFLVEFVIESTALPSPQLKLIELAQEIMFIGNRHLKNPEVNNGPEYICDQGYNVIFKRILQELLSVLVNYTDTPLRFLAQNQQANTDFENYLKDLESMNGLDFLPTEC